MRPALGGPFYSALLCPVQDFREDRPDPRGGSSLALQITSEPDKIQEKTASLWAELLRV